MVPVIYLDFGVIVDKSKRVSTQCAPAVNGNLFVGDYKERE